MYIYQRSVGAFQNDLEGLQPLSIETAKLSSVVKNTRLFFITVYDTLTLESYNVDMAHYRNETLYWDLTVQDWLDHKQNEPLIKKEGKIGDTPYYVRMEDLQMAGYNVVPGRVDFAPDYQSRITASGAKDLRVYHLFEPNPPYFDYVNTTLFTWNGYFVRAQAREDGIYLLGAGRHFNVNDHGHVGALDFKNISSIKTLPITEENINIVSPTSVDIHLGKEVSQQTVWLVVAGKLIPNYPSIRRVNENVINLDLRSLNLSHWVLETSKSLDMDHLPVTKQNVIHHDKLWSAETITQLMTDISSFIIVLSNPFMGIEVEPLEQFTFPTTFLTHDPFHHPVMLSNGRFPTYREREGGHYSRLLDFDIRYQDRYVNDSTGPDNGGMLYHDRVNWFHPHEPVNAYLYKIYSAIKGL